MGFAASCWHGGGGAPAPTTAADLSCAAAPSASLWRRAALVAPHASRTRAHVARSDGQQRVAFGVTAGDVPSFSAAARAPQQQLYRQRWRQRQRCRWRASVHRQQRGQPPLLRANCDAHAGRNADDSNAAAAAAADSDESSAAAGAAPPASDPHRTRVAGGGNTNWHDVPAGVRRTYEDELRRYSPARYGARTAPTAAGSTERERRGTDEAQRNASRQIDERQRADALRRYARMKQRLVRDTLFFAALGACATWAVGTPADAVSFVFGASASVVYVLLLVRSVDSLPAPTTSTSADSDGGGGGSTGTPLRLLVLIALILGVARNRDSLNVLPAIFGFFVYKVATVAPLVVGGGSDDDDDGDGDAASR